MPRRCRACRVLTPPRSPTLPLAFCVAAFLTLTAVSPVPGQHASSPARDQFVTTKHALSLSSGRLEYEATAGTLLIRDDAGAARARIFFTAYRNLAARDPASRPITFLFNGGPGSSSAWLHLGAFGPRRVVLPEDGKTTAPPRLVANECTLLDVTDLVFIDPVSTGYSRAAPGVNAADFHGVQEDVEATAVFIQRYLARFRRTTSPKFLAGESYGTTRAAAVASHLQEQAGVKLQGVILISVVLNFQTIRFHEGNDLPYPLFLPSYTALAGYHKKLAPELQANLADTLAESEAFAEGEYTAALMKGGKLSTEEREAMVRKLARLTSLSEEYVARKDLRIDAVGFREELLRGERRVLGRYDARFSSTEPQRAGQRPDYDPSRAYLAGPLSTVVQPYFRDRLQYQTDLVYRVSTDKVFPWRYGSARNGYLNSAPALRRAMTRDPKLRLFVASGYHDLATPYFATQYTLNHLGVGPASRVTVEHYPAGHMMYTEPGSHRKLKEDLAKFLRPAVPAKE